MMKLSPEPRLATAEALALRAWEASGRVPAVWEYDAEVGALLLEGFPNETPLSDLSEVGELGDVAGLIRALHGSGSPAIGGGLVSLAERVEFIFDHWMTPFFFRKMIRLLSVSRYVLLPYLM